MNAKTSIVAPRGTLVTCNLTYGGQFTAGKRYRLREDWVNVGALHQPGWVSVEADDKGKENGWAGRHFSVAPQFNVGDLVEEHGVKGIFIGGPDDRWPMICRLDGEGWDTLSRDEVTFVSVADEHLTGIANKTFWYVELADLKLVESRSTAAAPKLATPREPTAPMTKAVLGLLRSKGSLTSIEAQGVLRCRSLARRILDLKKLGWDIVTEMKRDATDQRYARYHLAAG